MRGFSSNRIYRKSVAISWTVMPGVADALYFLTASHLFTERSTSQ
jgi:hypothetical protein